MEGAKRYAAIYGAYIAGVLSVIALGFLYYRRVFEFGGDEWSENGHGPEPVRRRPVRVPEADESGSPESESPSSDPGTPFAEQE